MGTNQEDVLSFWHGRTVHLRAWETTDAELLWQEQWDSESIRAVEAGVEFPLSHEWLRAWLEHDAKEPSVNQQRFVIETLAGDVVGWANLRDWQNRAGTFTFAVRIYRAHQHHGYATDACRILLRYGFTELRCQKANSVTIESNTASIRLHQRLGFREEGRLRRNCFTAGKYWDEICFGLLREEFDEVYTS